MSGHVLCQISRSVTVRSAKQECLFRLLVSPAANGRVEGGWLILDWFTRKVGSPKPRIGETIAFDIAQDGNEIAARGDGIEVNFAVEGIDLPPKADANFAVWGLLPLAMEEGFNLHIESTDRPARCRERRACFGDLGNVGAEPIPLNQGQRRRRLVTGTKQATESGAALLRRHRFDLLRSGRTATAATWPRSAASIRPTRAISTSSSPRPTP